MEDVLDKKDQGIIAAVLQVVEAKTMLDHWEVCVSYWIALSCCGKGGSSFNHRFLYRKSLLKGGTALVVILSYAL